VQRRADFAPDKGRDTEVLLIVSGAGNCQGMAGDAPVVIESEDEIGGEAEKDGKEDATDWDRLLFFAEIKEPEEKNDCDGDAEDEAFEGAAVGKDDDAKAEKKSVTGALSFFEAGNGAENQSGAKSGDRTAPVAVHPVAEEGDADENDDGAEQSPARGEPTLQHPENGSDHGGGAEENANPGMAEKLAESEGDRLSWRIHSGIGGVEGDVESFEISGHRMRRIGDVAVSEHVRLQKVAKLVVGVRLRDGKNRKDEQA